ncbi:Mut7-C RNAse domain-containing protein [Dehalococcoides sp. THU3]|uniref:Mut7-C RNAse domain-containing protein n=1 Tax=Dehalococcoides TaxID=61434 RepID=UPI0005B5657A|nr:MULTISPECIES: Mut7-C RNAse domain-containing protein [Dehalococcoides]QYY58331.1 Mut7-C RNAse domain-containing protein [Dehalococcoides mccartyi]BAQ34316.1 hypothetical protein UCH007_03580 [Dehalococcoides sp. UCH007]
MFAASESPRFLVDQNVGKLAVYLRMLGFDTRRFGSGPDKQLVSEALNEGRIILTRDHLLAERRLVKKGSLKVTLFKTEVAEDQLRQLLSDMVFRSFICPFSRCIECNYPLYPVMKDTLSERVPPYVYQNQTEFKECHHCGRVFWKGSHWQAMQELLRRVGVDNNTSC